MTPHSNNADIIINPIIYFVISYHIVDINSLQEKSDSLNLYHAFRRISRSFLLHYKIEYLMFIYYLFRGCRSNR